MRFPVVVILALLFAGGAALADDTQVQRGPVPDWVVQSPPMPVPANAAGAMFVRSQDNEMHLDAHGQLQYFAYRLKLLNTAALDIGNLAIAWNPAAGAPTVHAIRIHRGSETIDVLSQATFEILRREEQLEAASLDGKLTAVLRVPDLRVGDELEFAFTARISDPTLGPDDAAVLALPANALPGRYHLRLSWEDGARPTIQTSPDLQPLAQNHTNAIDYRLDNPPVLTPPKDAPPRYQWQRVVEFSRFADWAAVSRRIAPLFTAASALDAESPLQREAARIAAANPQPMARASAALKLVQQTVRYVYVGLDGGNLTPASAAQTWQRRYGDCKAKTVLLLALLRELGIAAQAVLVNNAGADDGLDARLPSPRAFDHVLVRARIDGQDYWLDGTLPAVVAPATTPVMPYRWVLPLSEAGNPLEHLDWTPAPRPDQISLFEVDARAGFDQPARITSTLIQRGIAGLQEQVLFSALTPAQLLDGFRQQGVGDVWQTVTDVTWHYDQAAQASVLRISGTGKVDWKDRDNGGRSLLLEDGGFAAPKKRVRAAGQDQTLPYYNPPDYGCHVATIRLPAATRAGQWSHNRGINTRLFGTTYYRAFALRDGALRLVRGRRTEQTEVDAASAAADNDRIASFDNSMAQIVYDPHGRNPLEAGAAPVPATYEIDWTAATVPCLPTTPPDPPKAAN